MSSAVPAAPAPGPASARSPTAVSASGLDRWLFAGIDPTVYGLLRLFFGISAVCKFIGLFSPVPRLVLGGFRMGLPLHRYQPANFAPALLTGDLLPTLTFSQYSAVEVVGFVASILVTIGLGSRLASLTLATACWWLLLVDPAGFKHNLFALACFGVLLAVCPCGDRCSVDALLRRRRGRALIRTRSIFPLRLVQVQVAVIYLFSVLAKLNDGWASGHLLARGIDDGVARAVGLGLGSFEPLIRFRPLYAVASWATVAVEAFLIVGLLWPRTRGAALFAGVCLHAVIDVSVDVGSYSLTMFAAYVAFIDPVPRRLRVVAPVRLARVLRALDWLCRLDVVVGDRFDGAPVEVARKLPLTFVPALFWGLVGAFVVERIEASRRRRR